MRELKYKVIDYLGNIKIVSLQELNLDSEGAYTFDKLLGQYTGLKDKNGKEIYENDIIEYRYFKGFSGKEKCITAKVEFRNGCFGFYEYKFEDDEYFNTHNLENCVVVGE